MATIIKPLSIPATVPPGIYPLTIYGSNQQYITTTLLTVSAVPVAATILQIDYEKVLIDTVAGVNQYTEQYYYKCSDGSVVEDNFQQTSFNTANVINVNGFTATAVHNNSSGASAGLQVRPISTPTAIISVTIPYTTTAVTRTTIYPTSVASSYSRDGSDFIINV